MSGRRARLLVLAGLATVSVIGPSAKTKGSANTSQELVVPAALKRAQTLYEARAYTSALELLAKVQASAERSGDRGQMADVLRLLGGVAADQGHFANAEERYTRGIELARESGDRALEASILADIGHSYWMRAEYDRALEQHGAALAIQREIGDKRGEACTLRFIGLVHFKKGAYEMALDFHRRALAMRQELGESEGAAQSLCDIGSVFRERGRYSMALDFYEKSLESLRAINDLLGQVDTLVEIGIAYEFQGAIEEAWVRYEEARRLADAGSEPAADAIVLPALARIHRARGELEQAIECYQRTLSLRADAGDQRGQAWVLAWISDTQKLKGDLRQALLFRSRAEKIWEQINDRRALDSSLDLTGDIYFELGDYAHALESYERARELGERIQLPWTPLPIGMIGMIKARQGDLDSALDYGRRAIDTARTRGNTYMQWWALHRMGLIQRQAGLRDEALQSLLASLKIIEGQRSQLSGEEGARAGYLDDKQVVYADTIDLLLDMGRAEEALEWGERARARAFLELLSERAVQRAGDGEESRAAMSALLASGASDEHRTPMRGSAQDLSRSEQPPGQPIDDLSNQVAVPVPELSVIKQQARSRGATIVEYFSSDDRLFIWVLGPDGSTRTAVPRVGRRTLNAAVQEMRKSLMGGGAARASQIDRTAVDQSLRKLYGYLIRPIQSFLPQAPGDLVTIVPHGPLFLVSFAALIDDAGRYLIERHTLSYAPAISVLQFTASRKEQAAKNGASSVLLVGNPIMPAVPWISTPLPALPGAEAEIDAIRKLYPAGATRVATGNAADEISLREILGRQRIVHFATHGIVRDDLPLESFIALSPAKLLGREVPPGAADGRLTAREVFDLDLHAELVVLSACNTGLGRVNGDGMIGLSRAFMTAGVSSVIVSLWSVADVVARPEMEQFYRSVHSRNNGKAYALREAQLHIIGLLKSGQIRTAGGTPLPEHPIFWAPFVLIGEAI